jgi:D-threo-aldose 1-dehydrogenase
LEETMPTPIRKRKLGKTDLSVSEIGVGGAQFGNLYQPMSDQQAFDIMAFWIKQGVNLFDTAPFYGFGLSELRIGEFIQQQHLQDDIVLSTKVGRLLNPICLSDEKVCRQGFYSSMAFDAQFDYSYSGIMRSFFDSQNRMQDKSADILLIHDIGQMTHPQLHAVYWQQLRHGGLQALQELKQAGDIRAFGVGVNEIEVCQKLLDISEPDCILLAGRYTLLEQSALHELFPRCIQQGVSIMAGGVYNSGILASLGQINSEKLASQIFYNYQPAPSEIKQKVAAINNVCLAYQVPLAAAALQFVLAHPAVCAALPGNASVIQAKQTMAQYSCYIPDEFWTSLKQHGLLDEHAPVPMPNAYIASGTLN